jgi:hypothetical protein
MRQSGVNPNGRGREMTRNRPVGAFGIFAEGDVTDWEDEYDTDTCCFCGRKFNALEGATLFISVLIDAKYINAKYPGHRVGTGGTLCFKCFKGGPKRMADMAEKRADRLKRSEDEDKEGEIFTATIFRSFRDFSGFKGYKLAKAIADAQ